MPDQSSVVGSSNECSALLSPTLLVSPPNAIEVRLTEFKSVSLPNLTVYHLQTHGQFSWNIRGRVQINIQSGPEDDASSSHCASCRGSFQADALDIGEAPQALAHEDGLSVPPVEREWRNIQSFNSLYKPDVFPFMSALPSGRYGFMTPPVRSMRMPHHCRLIRQWIFNWKIDSFVPPSVAQDDQLGHDEPVRVESEQPGAGGDRRRARAAVCGQGHLRVRAAAAHQRAHLPQRDVAGGPGLLHRADRQGLARHLAPPRLHERRLQQVPERGVFQPGFLKHFIYGLRFG